MIVSATGKPATTTNPESIVAPGKAQEFEWYIHPQMQEGVRQFHSYSHDRELTVLGLFGAFIVEPAQGWPKAEHEFIMVMNGFDTNFDRANEVYAANTIGFAYMDRPIAARRA